MSPKKFSIHSPEGRKLAFFCVFALLFSATVLFLTLDVDLAGLVPSQEKLDNLRREEKKAIAAWKQIEAKQHQLEDIEKRYQAYPLVKEVRVYAEKDTIAAEIYPDFEYAAANGIADIAAALDAITDELNVTAQPSHTVARVVVRNTPLEKTATGKIRRNIA